MDADLVVHIPPSFEEKLSQEFSANMKPIGPWPLFSGIGWEEEQLLRSIAGDDDVLCIVSSLRHCRL